MKLMITSVGSLVGQNILDALEGRRDGIEVVGINSAAEAAGNFRCTRAYLAPPAAQSEAYLERLTLLLLEEKPDLVLPGRDDDVMALAALKAVRPALRHALPIGPVELARVFDDKWTAHEYARARGLPYVDSAPLDDVAAVEHLAGRYGYPLIAKPRAGNGSRGVRIVFDGAQLARLDRRAGYLLQPYLEPEADLSTWRELTAEGVPLFHAPPLRQIACEAIVDPHGALRGSACIIVESVMGRCERAFRLEDPAVDDVVRRYCEALAADGWVGAINLQGRRDSSGAFRVYELNGRFTGATAARMRLGFDEVGLLIEAFTRLALPPAAAAGTHAIVTKSLTEFVIDPAAVELLRSNDFWRGPVFTPRVRS